MKRPVNRPSPTAFRRSVGALAVALAAGAGAYASIPAVAQAAPASHHMAAKSTKYAFNTLNNQADPTFNQLLGINSHNVISGYFGAGTPGHPNKGYLLGRGQHRDPGQQLVPQPAPGQQQHHPQERRADHLLPAAALQQRLIPPDGRLPCPRPPQAGQPAPSHG